MRVLYIEYSLWEQVAQANGFTIYEKPVAQDTVMAWCGALDVIYHTDVRPPDYWDYVAAFPARTTVANEDEALARIVGLTGVTQPRSLDGTPQTSKQSLLLGREPFQRLDDGSTLMNINGLSQGSSDTLWNGTGAEDTGGDWTRGGVGSETAGSKYSGTNGLDTGVTAKDDTSHFTDSADGSLASFATLSFHMQPQVFPSKSELLVHWETVAGVPVGQQLLVNNYVSNFDVGVWKHVEIPIEDFGVGSDVGKLVFTYGKKAGQHFYFDDIHLLEPGSGGPKTFRVQAPVGKVWHVERVVLSMSAGDAGWNSNAFANIAGGLQAGLLLKYHKIGASPEVYWSLNQLSNAELFGNYQVVNDVNFADSDMLVVLSLEPNLSSLLLVDDDEVLDFVVRDNLSSLSSLRAFLHYGEEG